jgi:hypothetical protein
LFVYANRLAILGTDAGPDAREPGDGALLDSGGLTDGSAARACASDPSYLANPSTAIRYRAVTTLRSWTEAQADCMAADAHLVVIGDAAEDAHVDGLLVGEIWIGLSDVASEGTFAWVTGAPLVYSNWRQDGNPNDGSGTEPQDCAEIDETVELE